LTLIYNPHCHFHPLSLKRCWKLRGLRRGIVKYLQQEWYIRW
jgi:hypothetical protein